MIHEMLCRLITTPGIRVVIERPHFPDPKKVWCEVSIEDLNGNVVAKGTCRDTNITRALPIAMANCINDASLYIYIAELRGGE